MWRISDMWRILDFLLYYPTILMYQCSQFIECVLSYLKCLHDSIQDALPKVVS